MAVAGAGRNIEHKHRATVQSADAHPFAWRLLDRWPAYDTRPAMRQRGPARVDALCAGLGKMGGETETMRTWGHMLDVAATCPQGSYALGRRE